MKRRPKTPVEVRREAIRLALVYADERERCGDPEGAGEFRDLAKALRKMRMTFTLP